MSYGSFGRAAAFSLLLAAASAPAAAPPGFAPYGLGTEYTERGLAGVYGLAGLGWAKTRLEAFEWGAVEKAAPRNGQHTYDWSCTDALISEYQAAGMLEIQSYLSPESSWGSVATNDIMPKPEYMPDFEAWVGALVERYDKDGVGDMPGLRAPVCLWVAGPEWTGFWPSGNADDYLVFLAAVRRAARSADPHARIGLIPFFLFDVFAGNMPTDAEIEERLKDPPTYPAQRKSTAGMMKMLDRPDLFDTIDIHSLGDWTELPPTIAWFRRQMSARGYDRPVFVDDAFPLSPLASWHPSPTVGWPALYPVTEDRYQQIYQLLQDVAKLAEPAYGIARRWIQAEVAIGVVKKAVTAAGEGYWGIQIGNTEDWMDDSNAGLRQVYVNFIGAAAMMGLADVTHPAGGYAICGVRTAGSPRPGWHAMKQAADVLNGITRVEKVDGLGSGVWAYRLFKGNASTVVLWYEAKEFPLPLPGESERTATVDLPVRDATEVTVSSTVTLGAAAATSTVPVTGGAVRLTASRTPLFVAAASGKAVETKSVPVVLSAAGMKDSFFTSELALANTGKTDAVLHLDYTATWGTGSGTATDTLPAGRQKVVRDAVGYLRSLHVPIPESGDQGGPLTIRFEGLETPNAAAAIVRTTTALPEGRAGLSYSGLPPWRVRSEPVLLWGLRQDGSDRSNVAVRNAGDASKGPITLRLTILSGNPDTRLTFTLPDVTLAPGELRQLSGVLASSGISLSSGAVLVERTLGTAAFDAYAVANDQGTSDGSFVPPWPASLGPSRLTIPAVVETGSFSTEVVLGNASARTRRLRLSYVADALSADSADLVLDLRAGEQRFLPSFVDGLRSAGIPGVGASGPTFAGALFVTAEDGNPLDGIFAGARTTSPGGSGRFGLFYAALPEESLAWSTAWLHGLLQDEETRSNLAVVNMGDSEGTFRVEIFDGEDGRPAGTRDGIRLGGRRWTQVDSVLTSIAPGVHSGYARVTRTSGRGPFFAYAVLNDGASPGLRTGDGAYVEMARE